MNLSRLQKMLNAKDSATKDELSLQREYRARADMFDCPTFGKLAQRKEETLKMLREQRARVQTRAQELMASQKC